VTCRVKPERFGVAATEDEIVEAENRRVEHTAYVAYAGEPRTFREAMRAPAAKQWEMAIKKELEQSKRMGTYAWVPELRAGRKEIGSRWVLKEKRDGDGSLASYKARVVAQGFLQVLGQDFNATFASVARFTTLRALFAIAARNDWELHQVDVKGAYLQGELDEEIYMRVPEGADEPGKEGWFRRLLKPLYGLKQAGRQWKKKLDQIMSELGFEKRAGDECVYVKRAGNAVVIVVVVYVDDMAVAGSRSHVQASSHSA
jgi:hypothetical protein